MAKLEPVTVEVKIDSEWIDFMKSISDTLQQLDKRISDLEARNDWYGDGK